MKSQLKLFLTGSPKDNAQVISMLNTIKKRLGYQCQIEVIDVTKDPLSAQQENILQTPTLARELPIPAVKIVTSLDNTDKIVHLIKSHP